MRSLSHYPSEVDAPRLLWLERIADVELEELARAPRRDVEPLVVEGEVDVADQRRHRLEAFEQGRQEVGVGRLGGNVNYLLDLVGGSVEIPGPDRRAQVFQAHQHAGKP